MAAFYNRAGTLRLSGETRIPPGAVVTGDVAALGGPLEVGGTIEGAVLVINADLHLQPGARITGPVTVTGGRIAGPMTGLEAGATVYQEPLRFRWHDDQLIALGPGTDSWLNAGWQTWFGRAELLLAVDDSYNRVEGLPIRLGPSLRLGGRNPTLLEAWIVYRTRSGLRIHPDELGHLVQVAQYVGGRQSLRIGLGWYGTIDAIEDRGLSDTENSLTTFVMHRDYRDHYKRKGWSAFLIYGGQTRPLDVGLEYRDERHEFVGPSEPWSLLNNDDPWRLQPRVAEGNLRTLRGWLLWDTRNDRSDPATGWLVRVEVEQGLEGDLTLLTADTTSPVLPEEPSGEAEPVYRPVSEEFTAVRLDLRRYLRLGPRTRFALRVAAGGSADDGALPPQRQHVLGGEGSLPGYRRFDFDCGARAHASGQAYPYYGCDRSILVQMEGRIALFGGSHFSLGRRLGLDFELAATPELVVFADGGRAWIDRESLGDRVDLGPSTLRYDVGAGLRFGPIGAYLAVPLQGDEQANFFVRLGSRF
jgi:hypothetical protein